MTDQILSPQDVSSDDKLWALLSWILAPIVPIIVLLLADKKARPFIRYNAIQALAVSLVSWVLSAVLAAVVIGCFVGLAILVYQIYLAIQAYNGNWVTVPFLTDFCKKQNWI